MVSRLLERVRQPNTSGVSLIALPAEQRTPTHIRFAIFIIEAAKARGVYTGRAVGSTKANPARARELKLKV
jgi:hypothetical protein